MYGYGNGRLGNFRLNHEISLLRDPRRKSLKLHH